MLISNETPVAFDLIGQEKSERHVTATLMLTSDAERFNGTNIELRLREKTAGSNVLVMLEQKARYFFKQAWWPTMPDSSTELDEHRGKRS